jgi:hypothetical protein
MTDIKVLKLPVGDIPQIDQVSNIDILLIDEAQSLQISVTLLMLILKWV